MVQKISKYFALKSLLHVVMAAALSLSLISLDGCVPAAVRKDDAALLKGENLEKPAKNGVKKIIIPSFQVVFRTLVADTAQNKQNLFGASARASATMAVLWPNPDKALLQKVADAAYLEFAEKLSASGYEVVPQAAVTGSSAYKKLNGSSLPVVQEKYIIVAPTGMTIYEPMEKLDPNGAFTLGIFNSNMKGEGDIVKELSGDFAGVGVARVSLIVSIGGYKKESSTSVSGDTASASISFDPMVSLSPVVQTEKLGGAIITAATIASNYSVVEGYKLSGNLPKDTSRAWIESGLGSSVVAGSLKNMMTTAEKAGMVLVSVLGALSGQGASLEKYEFTVNAADYERGTKEVVSKFSEMVVGRFKGGN